MELQQKQLLKGKCVKKMFVLLREELINMLEEEVVKEKRLWVRKWISDRSITGASSFLLKQLRVENPTEYRLALRLTSENFDQLLSLIESSIQYQDTVMREASPAKIKLEVTLTYLATGMSYRSLSHLYRVPKPTISKFIPKVCRRIYAALKQYIKVPNTEEEWNMIECGFRRKWNFPSCYGAIDGKHVLIKSPPKSGS
ncbi:uncharacterized protein [Diabrotica undecimpunctata]|uniref:uncharacterized protein n=1 Tax=Diabrotica undecimpunctata TaxID=50387 RepID=UPI003B63BADA